MNVLLVICLFQFLFDLATIQASDPTIEEEEIRGRAFIELLNEKTAKRNNKEALAGWDYASNISEENLKKQVKT